MKDTTSINFNEILIKQKQHKYFYQLRISELRNNSFSAAVSHFLSIPFRMQIFTDRVSTEGNTIASVRLFSLYLLNWWEFRAKPPEAESSAAFEAPALDPNLTLVTDSLFAKWVVFEGFKFIPAGIEDEP